MKAPVTALFIIIYAQNIDFGHALKLSGYKNTRYNRDEAVLISLHKLCFE